MQYKIDAFKIQDWFDIDPRDEVAADLESIRQDVPFFKEIYTGGAPFFTLRYGDEIIMIYGFLYSGNGSYHPSLIPSKNISKHKKIAVKLIHEYFATYVPRTCRRLETYCDIMDTKAIRLAKHFGFDIIGIRHSASANGHDQAIMERLTFVDPRKVQR